MQKCFWIIDNILRESFQCGAIYWRFFKTILLLILTTVLFLSVSAATPFDPLLPAKGSTLRGGILTSFLVLLISTLIMWIVGSYMGIHQNGNPPKYIYTNNREKYFKYDGEYLPPMEYPEAEENKKESGQTWHFTETLLIIKWAKKKCCTIPPVMKQDGWNTSLGHFQLCFHLSPKHWMKI